VATYIQSGNVVFDARGGAPEVARRLAAAFAGAYGFASHVIVVPRRRWMAVLRGNPYPEVSRESPKAVHVGICDGIPDAAALRRLLEKTGGREQCVPAGSVVYIHTPDGLGRSKFAAGMEKASGVPMTVRNWRTAEVIAEMLG
jgi:uncharacterized protein (DUF1697 family)